MLKFKIYKLSEMQRTENRMKKKKLDNKRLSSLDIKTKHKNKII